MNLFKRSPVQQEPSQQETPFAQAIEELMELVRQDKFPQGLELEEDPTPFLHSMTENTIKGWMYSPVTGGGTASVEFEYLTGFSTLFQPPHTVAYQLYVEEGMPSLAALAGSQGYENTAYHPNKYSRWNRPNV